MAGLDQLQFSGILTPEGCVTGADYSSPGPSGKSRKLQGGFSWSVKGRESVGSGTKTLTRCAGVAGEEGFNN